MWSLRSLLRKKADEKVIDSPTNEVYEKLWAEGKPEIEKIIKAYMDSIKEAGNRYVMR